MDELHLNDIQAENGEGKVKKIKTSDVVLISIFTILLAFVIFVTQFWISLSIVNGDSMNQTLKNGDILITNMLIKPKRGDIVVFKYSESEDFIKRVIALEGDIVYNDDSGRVWLKKPTDEAPQLLNEPYLEEGLKTDIPFNFELAEGEILVLGDNRANSYDGRSFGPISEDRIIGVVTEFWVENKDFVNKVFAFRR